LHKGVRTFWPVRIEGKADINVCSIHDPQAKRPKLMRHETQLFMRVIGGLYILVIGGMDRELGAKE
jgi:hypothetical protein